MRKILFFIIIEIFLINQVAFSLDFSFGSNAFNLPKININKSILFNSSNMPQENEQINDWYLWLNNIQQKSQQFKKQQEVQNQLNYITSEFSALIEPYNMSFEDDYALPDLSLLFSVLDEDLIELYNLYGQIGHLFLNNGNDTVEINSDFNFNQDSIFNAIIKNHQFNIDNCKKLFVKNENGRKQYIFQEEEKYLIIDIISGSDDNNTFDFIVARYADEDSYISYLAVDGDFNTDKTYYSFRRSPYVSDSAGNGGGIFNETDSYYKTDIVKIKNFNKEETIAAIEFPEQYGEKSYVIPTVSFIEDESGGKNEFKRLILLDLDDFNPITIIWDDGILSEASSEIPISENEGITVNYGGFVYPETISNVNYFNADILQTGNGLSISLVPQDQNIDYLSSVKNEEKTPDYGITPEANPTTYNDNSENIASILEYALPISKFSKINDILDILENSSSVLVDIYDDSSKKVVYTIAIAENDEGAKEVILTDFSKFSDNEGIVTAYKTSNVNSVVNYVKDFSITGEITNIKKIENLIVFAREKIEITEGKEGEDTETPSQIEESVITYYDENGNVNKTAETKKEYHYKTTENSYGAQKKVWVLYSYSRKDIDSNGQVLSSSSWHRKNQEGNYGVIETESGNNFNLYRDLSLQAEEGKGIYYYNKNEDEAYGLFNVDLVTGKGRSLFEIRKAAGDLKYEIYDTAYPLLNKKTCPLLYGFLEYTGMLEEVLSGLSSKEANEVTFEIPNIMSEILSKAKSIEAENGIYKELNELWDNYKKFLTNEVEKLLNGQVEFQDNNTISIILPAVKDEYEKLEKTVKVEQIDQQGTVFKLIETSSCGQPMGTVILFFNSIYREQNLQEMLLKYYTSNINEMPSDVFKVPYELKYDNFGRLIYISKYNKTEGKTEKTKIFINDFNSDNLIYLLSDFPNLRDEIEKYCKEILNEQEVQSASSMQFIKGEDALGPVQQASFLGVTSNSPTTVEPQGGVTLNSIFRVDSKTDSNNTSDSTNNVITIEPSKIGEQNNIQIPDRFSPITEEKMLSILYYYIATNMPDSINIILKKLQIFNFSQLKEIESKKFEYDGYENTGSITTNENGFDIKIGDKEKNIISFSYKDSQEEQKIEYFLNSVFKASFIYKKDNLIIEYVDYNEDTPFKIILTKKDVSFDPDQSISEFFGVISEYLQEFESSFEETLYYQMPETALSKGNGNNSSVTFADIFFSKIEQFNYYYNLILASQEWNNLEEKNVPNAVVNWMEPFQNDLDERKGDFLASLVSGFSFLNTLIINIVDAISDTENSEVTIPAGKYIYFSRASVNYPDNVKDRVRFDYNNPETNQLIRRNTFNTPEEFQNWLMGLIPDIENEEKMIKFLYSLYKDENVQPWVFYEFVRQDVLENFNSEKKASKDFCSSLVSFLIERFNNSEDKTVSLSDDNQTVEITDGFLTFKIKAEDLLESADVAASIGKDVVITNYDDKGNITFTYTDVLENKSKFCQVNLFDNIKIDERTGVIFDFEVIKENNEVKINSKNSRDDFFPYSFEITIPYFDYLKYITYPVGFEDNWEPLAGQLIADYREIPLTAGHIAAITALVAVTLVDLGIISPGIPDASTAAWSAFLAKTSTALIGAARGALVFSGLYSLPMLYFQENLSLENWWNNFGSGFLTGFFYSLIFGMIFNPSILGLKGNSLFSKFLSTPFKTFGLNKTASVMGKIGNYGEYLTRLMMGKKGPTVFNLRYILLNFGLSEMVMEEGFLPAAVSQAFNRKAAERVNQFSPVIKNRHFIEAVAKANLQCTETYGSFAEMANPMESPLGFLFIPDIISVIMANPNAFKLAGQN